LKVFLLTFNPVLIFKAHSAVLNSFQLEKITMKVILTKDVDSLGDSGEVMTVSDGYARNFLFPQNMAIEATKGSMADLQRRIERLKAKAEKKHQEDLAKAGKITKLEVLELEANVGENGKLFGAITTKELAKMLEEKTGLELERKNMSLDNPIHKVGEYNLYVRLSSKVSANLKIVVKGTVSSEEG
jgi:large subunit ribosomal protein L9